jgi:hypothetical protein
MRRHMGAFNPREREGRESWDVSAAREKSAPATDTIARASTSFLRLRARVSMMSRTRKMTYTANARENTASATTKMANLSRFGTQSVLQAISSSRLEPSRALREK